MVFNVKGVLRGQSIVTVPITRELCGAPTNLSVVEIQSSSSELPKSILLTWMPPNTGSCRITSYTVFVCDFNVTVNGCIVDVSRSIYNQTIPVPA